MMDHFCYVHFMSWGQIIRNTQMGKHLIRFSHFSKQECDMLAYSHMLLHCCISGELEKIGSLSHCLSHSCNPTKPYYTAAHRISL